MKILVTGAAGFIGFHLSNKLLENKTYQIFGLDNLNNYYSVNLKKNRLKILKKNKNFIFIKNDISNLKNIEKVFKKNNFDYVFNLAAQAGVRYSIINPQAYFDSNILGFFNIINMCTKYNVKNLFFASSSSVYGNNTKYPLKETHNTDNPLSFYGASKKINEVIAASYANIHKTNSTALRFFTVYGPYGRPDMALFKFTKNIIDNKTSELFNNGNHVRDFTYIDDVIEALIKLLNANKKNNFEIFNIAGGRPVTLNKYILEIEKNLKIKGKFKKLKLQLGDVKKTHASSHKLNKFIGYVPKTKISIGVKKFVSWYASLYKK